MSAVPPAPAPAQGGSHTTRNIIIIVVVIIVLCILLACCSFLILNFGILSQLPSSLQ